MADVDRVGRYQLEQLLARGGMGQVYRATDTILNRDVALKRIDVQFEEQDDARRRFLREVRAAATVQSPHVVSIYDVGEIDGSPFVAMQLVKGVSVQEELRQNGPYSPAEAANIVSQVAEALDAAHKIGLVHRDVKPSNILIDRATGQPFVYLIDFGLAVATMQTRISTVGSVVGTLAYMAPEAFAGDTVTSAVDIYGLGCTLFEMLAGRPPYNGHAPHVMIAAHANSTVPQISLLRPELGSGFDWLIAKALAKNPDARFRTAGALAKAMEDATVTHDPSNIRVTTRYQDANTTQGGNISSLVEAGVDGPGLANSQDSGLLAYRDAQLIKSTTRHDRWNSRLRLASIVIEIISVVVLLVAIALFWPLFAGALAVGLALLCVAVVLWRRRMAKVQRPRDPELADLVIRLDARTPAVRSMLTAYSTTGSWPDGRS